MSLFKEKTKTKSDLSTPSLTIDAKHKQIMKEFNDERKQLDKLKKEYSTHKNIFEQLEKKGKSNLSDTEIGEYFKLKEMILKKKKTNKEIITEIE